MRTLYQSFQILKVYNNGIIIHYHLEGDVSVKTFLKLRRLSVSLRLIGSAMLGVTFTGYTCRTTVIYGTLKDGSLQINGLALNNYFSCRSVFQNGVNTLQKIVLKKLGFFFFVKNLKTLCSLEHTILYKFH